MKGVIVFRDIGIPGHRELLQEWRQASGIDQLPLQRKLDLAPVFFDQPMVRDRLSGILFLHGFWSDKSPWDVLLDECEDICDGRAIIDRANSVLCLGSRGNNQEESWSV
ncbi:hypothetical protein [Synechococcus sp. CBW1107]|jgi:hypothetical protein|uniref:hypothetical protein n=1 Tax=Synechococcus sp. CBW1107 TaxID=2789857 RepID=UPI002AD4BDF0|nr:hypothetical protein [Synechococcus sp. CBW1107]